VGLRLYTDFMISKRCCDWFHWVLTSFARKWNSFGNVTKRDELCDFDDFVVVCRWNAHVYSTTLICDLSVCIVEALEFVYSIFGSIVLIVLKLWNNRRTLPKKIFKVEYFTNLLWITLYDYMKIHEWLIGVEYDVYHGVMYLFSFTWIVRNCMKLLNYMI